MSPFDWHIHCDIHASRRSRARQDRSGRLTGLSLVTVGLLRRKLMTSSFLIPRFSVQELTVATFRGLPIYIYWPPLQLTVTIHVAVGGRHCRLSTFIFHFRKPIQSKFIGVAFLPYQRENNQSMFQRGVRVLERLSSLHVYMWTTFVACVCMPRLLRTARPAELQPSC
jgi:hypothetical protein